MPESSIREFVDNTVEPHIRGFLHLPEDPNRDGLVLTHGAGSNAQAPLLRALADVFCAAGFAVLRCDLPYRQVRSYGPPGPGDAARDRAGLKNALAAMRKVISGRLFLGGHSYGGRRSSMLCAELAGKPTEEVPDLVTALLLLSYPLHPPRKPGQQRTQHLPDLRTPTLFVHGTRDPFGSIAEMEQALKMIPARTKLVPVQGAGHDLGFKGKAKNEGLTETVLAEFEMLVAQKLHK